MPVGSNTIMAANCCGVMKRVYGSSRSDSSSLISLRANLQLGVVEGLQPSGHAPQGASKGARGPGHDHNPDSQVSAERSRAA